MEMACLAVNEVAGPSYAFPVASGLSPVTVLYLSRRGRNRRTPIRAAVLAHINDSAINSIPKHVYFLTGSNNHGAVISRTLNQLTGDLSLGDQSGWENVWMPMLVSNGKNAKSVLYCGAIWRVVGRVVVDE